MSKIVDELLLELRGLQKTIQEFDLRTFEIMKIVQETKKVEDETQPEDSLIGKITMVEERGGVIIEFPTYTGTSGIWVPQENIPPENRRLGEKCEIVWRTRR